LPRRARAGFRAVLRPVAAPRTGRLPRRAQPISIRGVERGEGIEDQGYVEGQPPVDDAVAPETSTTLDRAAEFEYHSEEFDPEAGSPDAEWSIRCIDVHKRLGGIPVLNGLNVAIPDNTITVVLGPSGTGKSVLIKHLIGLMFPDSGEILVHGQSVPSLTMPQLLAMRRRIGVLFQDGALFGSMSVFDNVAFPLRQHTDMSESQISTVVKQRLADVGLGDATDDLPSQLSGGMRKRAGFARALVMEPDIVIFDEPDSGLDPVRTALLCELIQEMHGQLGGTYIVVTHDIASARRIGQYIALLWKGRIVEAGDAQKMFSSENQFVRQFLSGSASGPLGMD
jgi:phospholipid/cholesterol/gamma-HCH transport system ATP-binding protein